MNRAIEAFDQFERKGRGWIPLAFTVVLAVLLTGITIHLLIAASGSEQSEMLERIRSGFRQANRFVTEINLTKVDETAEPTVALDSSIEVGKDFDNFVWVGRFQGSDPNSAPLKTSYIDLEPEKFEFLVWRSQDQKSILFIEIATSTKEATRNLLCDCTFLSKKEDGSFTATTSSLTKLISPKWQNIVLFIPEPTIKGRVLELYKTHRSSIKTNAIPTLKNNFESLIPQFYEAHLKDWLQNGDDWPFVKRYLKELADREIKPLDDDSEFFYFISALDQKVNQKILRELEDSGKQYDKTKKPFVVHDATCSLSISVLDTRFQHLGKLSEPLQQQIDQVLLQEPGFQVSPETTAKIIDLLKTEWKFHKIFESNVIPGGRIYQISKADTKK